MINSYEPLHDSTFREQTDTQNMLLAAIASRLGGVKYDSASDIKALVSVGLHHAIPVGEQFEAKRETSITVGTGDSAGITGASIDADVFLAATGETDSRHYEAVFDGAVWRREDGTAIVLADFGITVTGTPAEGDTVTVTETASDILLDVADHDANCSENEQDVVLVSHDAVDYGTIPFSAPQLLICAITALPAGRYRFTLDHGAYGGSTGQDGTYVFTAGTEIPAGGGIRHSAIGLYQTGGYTKAQITGGRITTYGVQPARAVIESNIAVSEWDGEEECTDLGTVTAKDAQYSAAISGLTKVNYTERSCYGSNRYAHSCYRKWLNSAGKAVEGTDTAFSYWWTPSDEFDMPPADASRKMAGFLHGLDPDLKNSLGEAAVVVEMPSSERTEGASDTETLYDKVFCLSKTEVFGGTNISVREGGQFALYAGAGSESKIKYQDGAVRNWFLRSARPSFSAGMRAVNTSGEMHHNFPFISNGVVCGMIIKARKA